MARIGEGPDGGKIQAVVERQAETGAEVEIGSGLRVLTVLATPLNYLILRALSEGPMRLAELRRSTGLPAQTTLRGHLASLVEIGAVQKRPTAQMPYAVESELTPTGAEMLEVARRLEAWLAHAPGGPVRLDSGAAKGVIKAFVDGWASSMMRSLGAGPVSLTELDRGIAELSYPALERRLASMRMAGLIEACQGNGVGTPYAVTEWARRGVVPLVAAERCELRHLRGRTAPITCDDVEAAFLVALPLIGLPSATSGSCRLAIDAGFDAEERGGGVKVTVERGRVVACAVDDGPTPQDFATGSAEGWLETLSDAGSMQLRLDGQVAASLVAGMRAALTSC